MDLRIPEEQMKQLVTTAIMQSLTQEHRDKLMEGAIGSLLTSPQKEQYSGRDIPGSSQLTKIFAEQTQFVAREIIRTMLDADDALKAKIRALLVEVLERVFVTNREKVVGGMAAALEKVVCKIEDY